MLLEEKGVSERLASERDGAEKEAREKEARVLALLRENEERTQANEELERLYKGSKAELEELMSTKGMEAKNYHELEKAKRALESQVRARGREENDGRRSMEEFDTMLPFGVSPNSDVCNCA